MTTTQQRPKGDSDNVQGRGDAPGNVAERNPADRRQEVKQHVTCMGQKTVKTGNTTHREPDI